MKILLTKEELLPHAIDAQIMGITSDGMLDALNLVSKAQLKKLVELLMDYSCGECYGEWHIRMPKDDWQELIKGAE